LSWPRKEYARQNGKQPYKKLAIERRNDSSGKNKNDRWL
jgi:hypothetical protein